MQNKLLKLFFILIFPLLTFLNVLAADQFNFDVTKIEILENGNKFIGSNRGNIISDNGLSITADTFEYNKISNILNTKGNIRINDPKKKYEIYAENVSYLKNQNKIFAKNKVKLIDNDKKTIFSDKLFIDLNKNVFVASDNVKIFDTVNNSQIISKKITYFKNQEKIITEGKTYSLINSRYNLETEDIVFDYLKKNIASKKNASITDKTKNATYQINNFSLSIDNEVLKGEDILVKTNASKKYNDKYFVKKGIFDLKNQTFVTQDIEINLKKDLFGNDENDPRIKGVSSSKKDGITTVNKGIFTSCKKNKDCVPWSIQAEKVEYNENKKQIYYDNALLKIYNTPIIYFPKFFHPGPSVKRQSGFLAPKITNSQTLGTAFQIPYYTVLSDNKDFTFTPTLFSENIFKFQNEYRQENKNSSFVGDFSFTNGYKSNTEKQRNSITHFFGKYSSNLELDNFVNSSLDITLQKVNNDTYLKVFDQNIVNSEATPESKDTLISKIELDLNHENYDLTAGFISYEDLQKDKSDRYEFALPYYVFSKGLWSEDNVGSLNFTSFGDNVLKDTNNLKSRMINDFDFASFNFINQSGFKNNLNFFVKNLITSAKNDPQYDSKISNELMGIIELQSSFPMMKTDDSFIKYLDPKISIRVNPSNMINYSAEDRRINNDNIFDINRLGLRDTLESGKSLTIGLDYKKESLNNINKYFELKLGTILRDKENNNIPSTSAITKKQSNIFGSLENNFNENLSLNYQFSINNNLDILEYNSLGIKYKQDIFTTEFNYIEEQGVIGNTNMLENKTSVELNNSNSLTFETRQNREIDLTEYYNLIYEYKNDCLIAGLKYNKTYYSDRDLRPSEDLMFTVTLIPITSIGQSVSK